MIVMKFGGTSVQDAGAIRRVAEIVRRHAERKVLVVVSACAGVTDQLVRLSQAIERRDEAAIGKIKETLIDKHKMEAQTLTLSAEEKEQLERFNGEFERCVNGASILHEVTPRTHDRLLSFGE
ncbi:MAG TPA: lysine-sensitive aspartokinase 3, partial [bacterium]|nr:lysine-sensitive aspartokinase 3 [bacterium]